MNWSNGMALPGDNARSASTPPARLEVIARFFSAVTISSGPSTLNCTIAPPDSIE
ncbi:hypothetical protein [Streptomyces sp. NPDC059063]|uniref:hypothetical protein n=1 Tax=unclassified Streptomyces TaxID=2593676 RepID=UPI003696772C